MNSWSRSIVPDAGRNDHARTPAGGPSGPRPAWSGLVSDVLSVPDRLQDRRNQRLAAAHEPEGTDRALVLAEVVDRVADLGHVPLRAHLLDRLEQHVRRIEMLAGVDVGIVAVRGLELLVELRRRRNRCIDHAFGHTGAERHDLAILD